MLRSDITKDAPHRSDVAHEAARSVRGPTAASACAALLCRYVPGAQNKIKNLADKAKAYVNNVTELEMKVLEATNHEPWGPHGSVMQGALPPPPPPPQSRHPLPHRTNPWQCLTKRTLSFCKRCAELTQDAFNVEAFYQIMGVVDQRLSEGPENWRLVYKALLLLEYMCKHGPMVRWWLH
jgi:ENTH domain